MKRARGAAAFSAVLAAAILLAHGDDTTRVVLKDAGTPLEPPSSLGPPPPVRDAGSEPIDPEAAVIDSIEIHDEVELQDALKNDTSARKQRAYNSDWMLRDYTAALQKNGLAPAPDRNAPEDSTGVLPIPNPKALLAPSDPLLPPLDNPDAPKTTPHTEPVYNRDTDAAAHPLSPAFLQPLLPPLTKPTDTVTRLDAWGSTTVALDTLPDNDAPNFITPGVHDLRSMDSNTESSLDVPGLTAERQTLGDSGDLDLPDQQMETATENAGNRARHDFLLPTVANSDSEFFKKQADALAPPRPPTAQLAALPSSGNIPLGPPHPVQPPMKMPVTTGIRSHVADPFDLIGGHRDSDAPAGY